MYYNIIFLQIVNELIVLFSENPDVIENDIYHKQLFKCVFIKLFQFCDLLYFTNVSVINNILSRLRNSTITLISTVILLPKFEEKGSCNIPPKFVVTV